MISGSGAVATRNRRCAPEPRNRRDGLLVPIIGSSPAPCKLRSNHASPADEPGDAFGRAGHRCYDSANIIETFRPDSSISGLPRFRRSEAERSSERHTGCPVTRVWQAAFMTHAFRACWLDRHSRCSGRPSRDGSWRAGVGSVSSGACHHRAGRSLPRIEARAAIETAVISLVLAWPRLAPALRPASPTLARG
jgi:hypothetical protein